MEAAQPISKEQVLHVLDGVKDPEIDTVSVVDLGMVEHIEIKGSEVFIQMLPTFLGCPALEIIEKNIMKEISNIPQVSAIRVEFIFDPPWTSERITPKGREGLKKFGIAPPPKRLEEDGSWHVDCPYCGSTYVTMENIFGPTACRSILYCRGCKNPFEAMKPVANM
ncbi:1,2-phenylacetyl-CoA epoxidase subunit PaaD [Siminovitchia sp. 179-K 8D1 HS]|uniref:1,2-phenylacetyl-CoA epoxidase subunit PaaD n=1 Tax=Siminovitchia sp. 179-K 8D1 HS TaxID=3142385 RepID=UPI0039A35FCC